MGILQHEWLNARGAIARFDRNTIEIRVLDVQECPLADLAISAAIVAVLKALTAERWTDLARQQAWAVEPLEELLLATIKDAELTIITNKQYLEMFGFSASKSCTAGELWQHLVEALIPPTSAPAQVWLEALRIILQQGSLARRLVKALGDDLSPEHLATVYRELCGCLAAGKMFAG